MVKRSSIGVFDSGYGGLTVLKEIVKVLPEYDYIYLGDNARAPYGTRSYEVVYEFTLQAVKELFARGCDLVILACNTASSKALRTIQQIDLPNLGREKRVLGVIRPSAETVGSYSKTGHLGILATEGTVNSGSYEMELHKFFPNLKIVQHACPIWVPLIENDIFNSIPGRELIHHDIQQLMQKDPELDVVLLGCTHYPLIQHIIEDFVGTTIQVIPQGGIVAQKLREYLKKHPEMEVNLSKSGTRTYLTTEQAEIFDKKASQFFGQNIQSNHIHF